VSVRWKIALALAAISVVAATAIGFAGYRSTRGQLLSEVDRSLVEVVGRLDRGGRGDRGRLPARGPLTVYDAQVVTVDGTIVESTFASRPAPSAAAMALAGDGGTTLFETIDVADERFRVRTIGTRNGIVQVARSLADTERVLDRLRARIALVAALVSLAAVGVGWWIAGRVTAPLRRLTAAAELVGTTGRLDAVATAATDRSTDRSADEIGRLADAFDRMLAALAGSRQEQQRLVQDAGHELRTPLTSLRTNLDTLRRYPDLPEADRDAIVADLHAETTELTDLVNEIVAVASGDRPDEPTEPVDLVELANDVVERFERRAGRTIEVTTDGPATMMAQRAAVQRALSCLLDNAAKFDVSGGAIEVSVRGATIEVADRGVGIPAGELGLVFDRFHRAEAARSLPGSGLGLSIVREIARRHGGDAFARNRDGGGTVVGFNLAPAAPNPPGQGG
jgi:two-component system, OmpR family, sensor histidine kinase MprB